MSHAKISALHIASGDRWAGAEVQVYTLLRQLHRDGEVRVAAILLNEGELAVRLRAEGIPVEVLDESRCGFPVLLRGTYRVLHQRRPDLVHTHRQKENLLGTLASWSLGIPSIRTVHGAPETVTTGLFKSLIALLDGWAGTHIQKRMIAVSSELSRQLRASFPGARVTIVANGIDVEAVRASAAPPANLGLRESGAFDVGIVGRLDPVKRVDMFLDMAAILLRRAPGRWRFHVFGEGRLHEALISQAKRLEIAPHIHFHGHRMDIAACVAAIDILVMCSDHEGLPMTPLEALAVGTPVVAHATGGLVEILTNEPAGILVHEHEPNAYANAVERLTQSLVPRCARELPPFLSASLSRYSAASNATTVTGLYREVLDEARG